MELEKNETGSAFFYVLVISTRKSAEVSLRLESRGGERERQGEWEGKNGTGKGTEE